MSNISLNDGKDVEDNSWVLCVRYMLAAQTPHMHNPPNRGWFYLIGATKQGMVLALLLKTTKAKIT
jgi:hypothetical protein